MNVCFPVAVWFLSAGQKIPTLDISLHFDITKAVLMHSGLHLKLLNAANITPPVTNLPSASSCPSTSKRNLFRGLGAEPRSRVLLKERSLLLTIWLIFWKRLDSCR